jgi:hypothetical protein
VGCTWKRAEVEPSALLISMSVRSVLSTTRMVYLPGGSLAFPAWRPVCSNHSRIPSAQSCYLCSRYVLLPMCPGWTRAGPTKDWSGREDLNLRPPGPETKKISQGVDFSIHVSGASTVQTHVIPARRSYSFSYGCPTVGAPNQPLICRFGAWRCPNAPIRMDLVRGGGSTFELLCAGAVLARAASIHQICCVGRCSTPIHTRVVRTTVRTAVPGIYPASLWP